MTNRRKPKVKISVGKPTLDEMGQAFLKAWRRAEAGRQAPEYHFIFETWDLMMKSLTPKRLELIRHLRKHPVAKITDLARALKRDYRNVHDDVSALTGIGLLVKTADGYRAPFGRIATEIRLDSAPAANRES